MIMNRIYNVPVPWARTTGREAPCFTEAVQRLTPFVWHSTLQFFGAALHCQTGWH
jgi:hypothetical protein